MRAPCGLVLGGSCAGIPFVLVEVTDIEVKAFGNERLGTNCSV